MMKKILDHGYARLIETWGSDSRIVEAARMSTGKGFKGWGTPKKPGDEKLLRYLYEHKHLTPFEMAGMTIEVQAPIFVFREWQRHRTQSFNEMSARYVELPNLFYVPSIERIRQGGQSKANKQGAGEKITPFLAGMIQAEIMESSREARRTYERLLCTGVARELARLVIPVNQYSRMRASANLRNWLAFLTLRMDVAAQYEIREYAEVVGKMIEKRFPKTYALFLEGRI